MPIFIHATTPITVESLHSSRTTKYLFDRGPVIKNCIREAPVLVMMPQDIQCYCIGSFRPVIICAVCVRSSSHGASKIYT